MLNPDQTHYVRVDGMQLLGKAVLRWHQAHLTDELTPLELLTWWQFSSGTVSFTSLQPLPHGHPLSFLLGSIPGILCTHANSMYNS